MAAAIRSPASSSWRDIASLGEQIVNAPSLAAQRDHITAMTSRLIKGEVDLWLDENVFRLPGLQTENVFPERPPLPGMQRALKAGQVRTKQQRRVRNDRVGNKRQALRHALAGSQRD